MKQRKSRKERKTAELRKAEKWWAELSDADKRLAYAVGKLAKSLKAGALATLVMNPEDAMALVETLYTESAGPMKKCSEPGAKTRIEGNSLN